jgi:N,N-dimethylformamidase
MLSGPAEPTTLNVVRLIHGDPNPRGPGYRAEPVDWGTPTSLQLEERSLDLGSYVEIPDSDSLHPAGAFSFAVWIFPTALSGRWQAVAAKASADDFSYAVYCAGQNFVTAAVSPDGRTVEWCTGAALVETRAWQLLVFSYDPNSCEASLFQASPNAGTPPVVNRKRLSRTGLHRSSEPLLLGASRDARPAGRGRFAHFDGKLARPLLLDHALTITEVEALARGEAIDLASTLGAWDFSLEVAGARVIDGSPHSNHGTAMNMPARAVTGPTWDGDPQSRYTEAPRQHDAIHFHADDLDDAEWPPTVHLAVPPQARSGIYAAVMSTARDQLFLPFVVKPSKPTSAVALLVPTLTWQAYGSNRLIYSHTEDGVLDLGVCIYNAHSDGSIVYYATRRRPTRSWNPCAGFPNWGSHALTSDLYLVDWLEAKNFPYDALSDEHLHREGASLLTPYQCLILSSHPEYWTLPMIRSLRSYIHAGGRVLYLGGNGLYWVTSLDSERPFVMEVRKRSVDLDVTPWTVGSEGEYEHSTTLELGGLWQDRGLPPRNTLGVDYAANVFTSANGRWGFERLPASWDATWEFVFDGVEAGIIGNFGLNLGSAAAVEMDATPPWESDAEETRVPLARASHELFTSPKAATTPPVADITLTAHPGGGAVFAAGSIAWTGSLSHNGYDNSVSRITENVLRRFLERPPSASIL